MAKGRKGKATGKNSILSIVFVLIIAFIVWRNPELLEKEEAHVPETPVVYSDAELTVAFIDVGQGDSIFIRCGEASALIDTGEYENIEMLTSALDGLNVSSLDLVVGTHPHSDHIGSMATVIREYKPADIMIPDVAHNTTSFEKMIEAAEKNSCNFIRGEEGVKYELGDALLTILSPEKGFDDDNLNNWSVVIRLDFDGISMLFAGDAEAVIERSMLKKDLIGPVNVFKVSHHGSSTSNTEEFLDKLDPDYAVIMLAKDNEYGHPHRETMTALGKTDAKVLRTDKNGTVIFTVKEGELTYVTEK